MDINIQAAKEQDLSAIIDLYKQLDASEPTSVELN